MTPTIDKLGTKRRAGITRPCRLILPLGHFGQFHPIVNVDRSLILEPIDKIVTTGIVPYLAHKIESFGITLVNQRIPNFLPSLTCGPIHPKGNTPNPVVNLTSVKTAMMQSNLKTLMFVIGDKV
jgi:hypothetical protein